MWLIVALMVWFARPAEAQPVACATTPSTGPVIPFTIDLTRHPGVPKDVGGDAVINLPAGAPAGADCHVDVPLPTDVLAGPPSSDLLRGPDEKPMR
jgi:hypothetical protein